MPLRTSCVSTRYSNLSGFSCLHFPSDACSKCSTRSVAENFGRFDTISCTTRDVCLRTAGSEHSVARSTGGTAASMSAGAQFSHPDANLLFRGEPPFCANAVPASAAETITAKTIARAIQLVWLSIVKGRFVADGDWRAFYRSRSRGATRLVRVGQHPSSGKQRGPANHHPLVP